MDPAIRAQVEVLRLADGFFESTLLCSLATLGVFEALGDAAVSATDLAPGLGADAESLHRALRAAVALGILERGGESTFAVPGPLRPALIDPNRDGYVGHWLRYVHECQRATTDLVRLVRDPTLRLSPDGPWRAVSSLRNSTWAMHDYAALRGRALAERLDWSSTRSLLDVGCGPGTYALQIASRDPALRVCLVDVAEVLSTAREVAGRFALPNEIDYRALDLAGDEIEGVFDAVLVSNVLMALGAEKSQALLGRLHANVTAGGRIVVQAPFLAADGIGPRWPAIVDLLLLCTTGEGRNHTVEETSAWLAAAGFEAVEEIKLGAFSANGVLAARKPGS